MLNNLEHWQSFYDASNTPTFPSQFAVFVQSWLVDSRETIVELGCGNGRDSLFLNQAGHDVIATDQVIGESLKNHADRCETFQFKEGDVADVVKELASVIDLKRRVVIYSRFFQHAINEETERRMLKTLAESISEDSELFFEFRMAADKDRPKVFGTDHYRRFQTSESFLKILDECDLTCTYSCEGTGYARYGSEDPVVGRFVAKPKPTRTLRIV